MSEAVSVRGNIQALVS